MKAEGDFTQMVLSDGLPPQEQQASSEILSAGRGSWLGWGGGGLRMGEDRKGLFVQIDSS